MNTLLKPLIEIAISQIGIREVGGNNNGTQIREYQHATWLKPDSWPWCAAFVDWCIEEWLNNSDAVLSELQLTNAAVIDSWRPKTASAFDLVNWAKKHGLHVTDEKEQALAGDIVVYDFSHCGFVIEDQLPGKDYIVTAEGNTNGKGERDSISGDGVWQKQRKTNLVRNYIRIFK